MTDIVIVGGATGALLGLRQFKVLVLVPAIFLAATGTIVIGVVTGLDHRNIEFDLLAIITSLEIGYFFSSLATVSPAVRVTDRGKTELLHVMQTAIGQELRTAFELSRDLPPEWVALVTRLDERHA
jgi:hypothetical protein